MNNPFELPDFIIAGAQKCGTSTLHFALKKHPEVFMSSPKELNFFHVRQNYERGIEWYASFFKECHSNYIAGESTPEYFHYEQVPKRIANTLPNVKIIILLRNPVDRAYSNYWHSVRYGHESLRFEHAIQIESHRIAKDPRKKALHSYLYRGHYVQQIERYLQLFDRSRILIIIAEEYFLNPELILTQITDFLKITCDQEFLDSAKTVSRNVARLPRSRRLQRHFPYLWEHFRFSARVLHKLNTKKVQYPSMSLETRKELLEYFSDDNSKLEKLLDRDLSIWNNNGELP